MKVPIDKIIVDVEMKCNEELILAQAETIKNFGLFTPIKVRMDSEDKYHLVAGVYRLMAAKEAGLEEVEIEIVENELDLDGESLL